MKTAALVMGIVLVTLLGTMKVVAAGPMVFEVYDVSDLVFRLDDFHGCRFPLPPPRSQSPSLVLPPPPGPCLPDGAVRAVVCVALAPEMIFRPETEVELHRGILLITTTPRGHRRVEWVLSFIRNRPWLARLFHD